MAGLTQRTTWILAQFAKFLIQAGDPRQRGVHRDWSPALYAYVWGLTEYCPEEGEL